MVDIERNVKINILVNTRRARGAFEEINKSVQESRTALEILRDTNLKAGEAMRQAFQRAFESATTFRNEMLSLLFGTMSVNMTLGALIGNIMDMMGASEAWQLIWLELLWDAVAPLVDFLWWLVDVIEALPQPLKNLIGLSMVALAVLSQIGFFIAVVWQTAIAFFGARGAGLFPILKNFGEGTISVFKRLKELGPVKLAEKVFNKISGFAKIIKNLPRTIITGAKKVFSCIRFAGGFIWTFLKTLAKLFMGVGATGALAFGAILYVLQYLLRYGFGFQKIIAMILVDLLRLFQTVLDGASALFNALLDPFRGMLAKAGIHIPEFRFGAVLSPIIDSVKEWGGVQGEYSAVEGVQTQINVFVDKLMGKDPDALVSELDTAIGSGAGGRFTSVNVG